MYKFSPFKHPKQQASNSENSNNLSEIQFETKALIEYSTVQYLNQSFHTTNSHSNSPKKKKERQPNAPEFFLSSILEAYSAIMGRMEKESDIAIGGDKHWGHKTAGSGWIFWLWTSTCKKRNFLIKSFWQVLWPHKACLRQTWHQKGCLNECTHKGDFGL